MAKKGQKSGGPVVDALSADGLQEAITRCEAALRQRLRSRFGPATMQHATDFDDIIQLVRLRLHELHASRQLTVGTNQQLAALIYRIAHDRVIDAIRGERRLIRLCHRVGTRPDHRGADARDAATAGDVQMIMSRLGRVDSEIFYLFAHGYGHSAIARIVGLSMQAYRSRWRRLGEHIRAASQIHCSATDRAGRWSPTYSGLRIR